MIIAVREWYGGRTRREQLLLLAMVAIAVPVLVWLLIVMPVTSAYREALQDQLEAVDRHGRVLALADAAKAKPAKGPSPDAGTDMQLLLTEAAGQAGIALQQATPDGPDAASVAAAGVRAPAVAQWLRELDARGITVSELRMTPQGDGSVSLSARLVRGA